LLRLKAWHPAAPCHGWGLLAGRVWRGLPECRRPLHPQPSIRAGRRV